MDPIFKGNAKELSYLFPEKTCNSTWSSPEALARYIQTKNQKEAWNDSAWTEGKHFTGSESMEETLDLALNGWKEGAEQVEKTRNRIRALYPLRKTPSKFSIAGAVPSVPRAVAGNIMNMKSPDLTKAKRKTTITLLVDTCFNGSVNETQISNRAAVIAALVDEIENSGFTCEVILVAISDGRRGFSSQTLIRVKDAGQSVDTKRLAFGLGHASMFRRLIFADWQTEPACKDGLGNGLGTVHAMSPTDELTEKNIYVLPSANPKFYADADEAAHKGLKYLIAVLQAQGCPAFPKAKIDPKLKEELYSKNVFRFCWNEGDYEFDEATDF